jgi:uncharacterized membrane protein YhaH (DUF805 family)
LIAVAGGYFLREALTTNNEISPYYVEITFIWRMIVLGLLTPFAMQRSRDIGISRWWVLLIWLSPLSDFKFLIIVSEYTEININGKMLWLATIIALMGFVYMITLFFSRSDDSAIK